MIDISRLKLKERIIVGLDVDNLERAEFIVNQLKDKIKIFKVGQVLFSACGIQALKMLKDYNKEIFLDLKYHDIPYVLYEVGKTLVEYEVLMATVHCLGGWEMLDAIITSVNNNSSALKKRKPLIIGVTILTSITQEILENDLNIKGELKQEVLRLARLGKRIGLDGITASCEELELIKKEIKKEDPNFLVITPGIRLAPQEGNDQRRIGTPIWAFQNGADFIVLSRPVVKAKDPKVAIDEILSTLS
jgi:orotidine-5'-phosphate decarboxylase